MVVMIKIGLSGGIGSGKSTVVKMLSSCGAYIIDSDKLAREVVEPGTPGLHSIVEHFGEKVLAESGELNRNALSAIVFQSDEARKVLNSITHPRIAQRTQQLIEEAPRDSIIVHDTPLLVELNLGVFYDAVIIVWASMETRLHRLQKYRDMPQEEALSRIHAQTSDEIRSQTADVVIDNNSTVEAARAQVYDLFYHYLVPWRDHLIEGEPLSMPISLVSHQGKNPIAPKIIARLWTLLHSVTDSGIVSIEHIGATSMNLSLGQDIIDIHITVTHWNKKDIILSTLKDGGYVMVKYRHDEEKLAEYILSSTNPLRKSCIYIHHVDNPCREMYLHSNEFLRLHPQYHQQYIQSKVEGLLSEKYSHNKKLFFESLYPQIQQWRA